MNYFLMMGMVVLVMATVPLHVDASIDCYTCIGYDSSYAEHPLTNNKNCPQGSFDKTKVNTAKGANCYALIMEQDGKSVTERAFTYTNMKLASNLTTRSYSRGSIHGYVCDQSLCNDVTPSASTTLSFQLPLLLLPLLAAMSRCLA